MRILIFLITFTVTSMLYAQEALYHIEDKLTKKIIRCEKVEKNKNITIIRDCDTGEWLENRSELLDGTHTVQVLKNNSTIVLRLKIAAHNLQPGMSTTGTMAIETNGKKDSEVPALLRVSKHGQEIIHELSILQGKIVFRKGYTNSQEFPDWVEEIEKLSTTSRIITFHELARRVR